MTLLMQVYPRLNGENDVDHPIDIPQTLHGTAIYAYIDPSNHPNVGKYTIHGVSEYYTVLALLETQ